MSDQDWRTAPDSVFAGCTPMIGPRLVPDQRRYTMNAQRAESTLRKNSSHLAVPVSAADHIRGAADARATIVVYGDFQSPECADLYRILAAIPRDFHMNWRYVFRHLPMVRQHPQAIPAAEAAEAAAAQGKFWDLHDAMFEHQAALSANFIRKMARRLGLDLGRFDADVGDHRFAERIKGDVSGALNSGAPAAPAVYIESVLFDGALTQASITAELTRCLGQPPRGS
jgi:formate-nitrite transporter family protein